jgi:NAD(P)H-hydrate epimerase
MRIVSTKEMIEIEDVTKNEFFFDEKLIIENVGVQAASVISQVLLEKEIGDEVLFLVGKGSNGADGMATARHLSNLGHKCRAFILFAESDCKSELLEQIKMAKAYKVAINFIDSPSQITSYFEHTSNSIIVDALFGTGVQLPLSNFLYEVIDYINYNSRIIFSLDIPSGVNGNSGEVQGNAVKADLTLAIGFPKLGHYVADGAKHSGELYVLDVGFPSQLHDLGDKYLLRPEHMMNLVADRDKFADKKSFGHSLVLGGSHGLTGAIALASHACLKVGSGLVTVATWEPQYNEMIHRLIPEVMTGYLPLDVNKWDNLIKDLNKYSSIVIGPGLARSSRARRLVLEVLNNYDGPVIIDADAINVLNFKEDKNAIALRNAPTVLTPHFGEFSRFSGVSIEELTENPVGCLKNLVNSINCTIVLKGPCTYLGCSDGNVYFNYYPNDGMASGGTGDVLAGILGGLLGQESELTEKSSLVQKYETFNRTVAVAIYTHSLSGRYAADKYGVRSMSAQSIINCLPEAFSELEEDFDKISKVEK